MAGISTTLREQVIDYISGTDFPASPAGVYLTLSTADPQANGTGLAEPAGITRTAFTMSIPAVNDTDGVSVSNTNPIQFSSVSGTITHIALMDAATGGNMLCYGPLDVTRVVTNGDSVSFAAGTIKFSLTGLIGGELGTQLFDWIRGASVSSAPASVDLVLSTTQINRDGTNITRPINSAGYTDQPITFSKGPNNLDGIVIFNSADIIFGPSTTATWGAVTHVAVIRHDTAEMMLYGPVSNPVITTIGNGTGVVAGAFAAKVT